MTDVANEDLLNAIRNVIIEKILVAHTGIHVSAGGRSSCAIALVERERLNSSDNAVFIFSSESSDLQLEDLTLDQVLPIDSNFVCDIGPPSSDCELRVVLKDGGGLSVVLELPANASTDAFISEIYGVVEIASELGKNFSSWSSGPKDTTLVDQVILKNYELNEFKDIVS